jgi:hypothetical protein
MNDALNILGLSDTRLSDISLKDIKNRYRIYALMYHPDKNKSEDASMKFLEIKGAYEYLKNRWNTEEIEIDSEFVKGNDNSNSYTDILHSVLNILAKNQKINETLEKILSLCENKFIQIIENLDKRKFNLVYTILKKYKNVFCLSDHFFQEMEFIKNNKTNVTNNIPDILEIITLTPSIDDMWDNLVYKYTREDQVYYVPLWHKELIYEHNKKEFIIECILEDDKIWIDEDNNIHQEKTFSILDIFEKDLIEVCYGTKSFTFSPEIIQLKKYQIIVWYEKGISKIMPDIQNISKKSDVYLHIYLQP